MKPDGKKSSILNVIYLWVTTLGMLLARIAAPWAKPICRDKPCT